jgi:hypothetical protein
MGIDLPLQTHTFFIEPISECIHLKNTLIKRFLTFIQNVRSSPKCILTNLLKMVLRDVRSVTGSNLRHILLLVNKCDVGELQPTDSSQVKYRRDDDSNSWKIKMVKEVIEVNNEILEVDNFDAQELQEILHHLCVD